VNQEPKRDSGHQSELGELLALGLASDEDWTPAELAAALDEQLAVPIEFELSSLKPAQANRLRLRAAAHGLVLKSLGDLLLHHRPPLELLVMAKDYFKANTARPRAGFSAEVARTLYYLTLATAWLRHRTRISTLDDARLVAGLDWVLQQEWVAEKLRALAAAAATDLRQIPQQGNT